MASHPRDEAARGDLSLRETLALLCPPKVSHREEQRIQVDPGIAKFPHQQTFPTPPPSEPL